MTVLVAYASKHGSTEGIARAIADRLSELGVPADVQAVERRRRPRRAAMPWCSGAPCMRGPG